MENIYNKGKVIMMNHCKTQRSWVISGTGLLLLGLLVLCQTAHAESLLNINFSADKNPTYTVKTGPAAIGAINDYWNVYSRDVDSAYNWRSEGTIRNLLWASSNVCPASVSLTNASGFWANSIIDPMYNTYLYSSKFSVWVADLPAGSYDFYLYGHGAIDSQNSVFNLVSAGQDYGDLATTTSSTWKDAAWMDGQQYVIFKQIKVETNRPVIITVNSGKGGLAIINGMQIASQETQPRRATATAQVVNGFLVGITVTDGGVGYSNNPPPVVRIRDASGSNATAHAVVNNGVVQSIQVDNPGKNYSGNATVVIASPSFMPWLDIAVSKVKVTQHVVLGKNYVLESSTNLKTWNPVGPKFIAEDESITLEFDVDVVGRNFRIQEVP